jgi:hypothetical protein
LRIYGLCIFDHSPIKEPEIEDVVERKETKAKKSVKKEKKNDTEIVHDSDEKFLSLSEIQNDDLLNLFHIVYHCSDIEKLMDVYDYIKDFLKMTYNGLVYFPFVNNDDISNEKNFQNNIIEIVNDENIPDEDFFYFKELIHSIILSNESNPP